MVELQHGRTLTIEREASTDLVEIRAPDGALELRLKLTADGVTLQLEAARIALKAEESINVDCESFNLRASGDVRVRGERVYIN